MVNRFDANIARTSESTGNKASDASPSVFSRKPAATGTDDLIRSLSNAYENKRARQVFEWESTRRRYAPMILL